MARSARLTRADARYGGEQQRKQQRRWTSLDDGRRTQRRMPGHAERPDGLGRRQRWPSLAFNPRVRPCPPRARQHGHPRRFTVSHGATGSTPSLCDRRFAGGGHLLCKQVIDFCQEDLHAICTSSASLLHTGELLSWATRTQGPGVLMTARSRRRDNDRPVPPVPGALGLPTAPARRPARRRGARVARTLRTCWWPRFLVTGALVVVVGATLVSGAAAPWVIFAGAAIIFISLSWSLSMSPADYRREAPMPPGSSRCGVTATMSEGRRSWASAASACSSSASIARS